MAVVCTGFEFHTKEYGAVPPVGFDTAVPSDFPLQLTSVLVTVVDNTGGLEMVAVF